MSDKKSMMKTFWFHLRSGGVIKMKARDLDAKVTGGKLTSYTFSGAPVRTWYFWRRRVMFFDPSEIIAIEVRGG